MDIVCACCQWRSYNEESFDTHEPYGVVCVDCYKELDTAKKQKEEIEETPNLLQNQLLLFS